MISHLNIQNQESETFTLSCSNRGEQSVKVLSSQFKLLRCESISRILPALFSVTHPLGERCIFGRQQEQEAVGCRWRMEIWQVLGERVDLDDEYIIKDNGVGRFVLVIWIEGICNRGSIFSISQVVISQWMFKLE